MRKARQAGEIWLLLAVTTLLLVVGLGAAMIGPDLLAWQTWQAELIAQETQRGSRRSSVSEDSGWVLPPTWTPGGAFVPTPTVTMIPLGKGLLWPTVSMWHTPIVPTTPLARPTETTLLVIGHSAQGRALEVTRFGQGPVQRMIVAGIHGGYEWNTTALADELITYLRDHPELIPPQTTLYILRLLNPDGLALGRGPEGHNNARGVDLNRNWDANWQATWPRLGCFRWGDVSAGKHPGSEPETQALMAFLAGHQISGLVSFHSAGPGIYASGDPPHPESEQLAEHLSKASGYIFPGPFTGCVYTGNLVDWAYHALGIPGVDVELSSHYETDFKTNLRLLAALVNWAP